MNDNSDLATCAITWLGVSNQQANTERQRDGAGENVFVYIYTTVCILGYEDTCRDLAE